MTTMLRTLASLVAAGLFASAAGPTTAATAYGAAACRGTGNPLQALPLDRVHSAGSESWRLANNCRSNCQPRIVEREALLALDMPPALPLLLVTRAEDVVAWHTEIYQSLAEVRAQPDRLLCERSERNASTL